MYGPEATLLNNVKIWATVEGQLPLHSSVETKALIFLQLNNESLLSIGQLCDNGCIPMFDIQALDFFKW